MIHHIILYESSGKFMLNICVEPVLNRNRQIDIKNLSVRWLRLENLKINIAIIYKDKGKRNINIYTRVISDIVQKYREDIKRYRYKSRTEDLKDLGYDVLDFLIKKNKKIKIK
jgi:hypothetical protein